MEEEEDERYTQALEHKLAGFLNPDMIVVQNITLPNFHAKNLKPQSCEDITVQRKCISVMWAFLLELSLTTKLDPVGSTVRYEMMKLCVLGQYRTL